MWESREQLEEGRRGGKKKGKRKEKEQLTLSQFDQTLAVGSQAYTNYLLASLTLLRHGLLRNSDVI